jgi:hypothetical protein
VNIVFLFSYVIISDMFDFVSCFYVSHSVHWRSSSNVAVGLCHLDAFFHFSFIFSSIGETGFLCFYFFRICSLKYLCFVLKLFRINVLV